MDARGRDGQRRAQATSVRSEEGTASFISTMLAYSKGRGLPYCRKKKDSAVIEDRTTSTLIAREYREAMSSGLVTLGDQMREFDGRALTA